MDKNQRKREKEMNITKGEGQTIYGPGVSIELTGEELAQAIGLLLYAKEVQIFGPRTIRVNGELCESASVYVDPSGYVIKEGDRVTEGL